MKWNYRGTRRKNITQRHNETGLKELVQHFSKGFVNSFCIDSLPDDIKGATVCRLQTDVDREMERQRIQLLKLFGAAF